VLDVGQDAVGENPRHAAVIDRADLEVAGSAFDALLADDHLRGHVRFRVRRVGRPHDAHDRAPVGGGDVARADVVAEHHAAARHGALEHGRRQHRVVGVGDREVGGGDHLGGQVALRGAAQQQRLGAVLLHHRVGDRGEPLERPDLRRSEAGADGEREQRVVGS
jgi:hypothetical protein